MKKFFFVLVAALAVLVAGCNNDASWGIEYSLQSDGKTDASVTLMIFNGQFSIKNMSGKSHYFSGGMKAN